MAINFTNNLTHREATIEDIRSIISLLIEDDLGQSREHIEKELDNRYLESFKLIDRDSNQYLMVVENKDIENRGEIIATCHLTIMPSLTFIGSTRMQIEAVRVSGKLRGQKIGEWMIGEAVEYGKSRGAKIIQLTTNKKRDKAKHFYEKLGFAATHEGMKLYI